jgi:hypothetical protein
VAHGLLRDECTGPTAGETEKASRLLRVFALADCRKQKFLEADKKRLTIFLAGKKVIFVLKRHVGHIGGRLSERRFHPLELIEVNALIGLAMREKKRHS